MTITINPIFLYCWILIAIFETIHAFIVWKQLRKKLQGEKYKGVFLVINELKKTFASIRLAHKMIFNPVVYFAVYILFCIVSPVLFLSTIKTIFKKIIGYKTKLEKEVDEQEKSFEESRKRSEEFMKNEGVEIDKSDIEFEEINFDEKEKG